MIKAWKAGIKISEVTTVNVYEDRYPPRPFISLEGGKPIYDNKHAQQPISVLVERQKLIPVDSPDWDDTNKKFTANLPRGFLPFDRNTIRELKDNDIIRVIDKSGNITAEAGRPAQEFPNQHLSKIISKLKDFQATVYRLYEEKHEIYNQNIENLCSELKEFQQEYEENVVARGLDKQEFPIHFKCENDEAFYVYSYPLTKSSEELSQFRQSFIKGRMIEFFSVSLAPKSFVFEKDQFYSYRTANCKLLEGVFCGRIDYDLAQELTHGTCEV